MQEFQHFAVEAVAVEIFVFDVGSTAVKRAERDEINLKTLSFTC